MPAESASLDDALAALFAAADERNREAALEVVAAHPSLARESLHAAAMLGDVTLVRRHLSEFPSSHADVRGPAGATPLLWLGFSPFHGESAARDEALAASARVLLDAGADPNARDSRYGVSTLYAVTGHYNVPHIARMLLEAGASPNDGESAFHAAEMYHIEALALLQEFGVDLNAKGDWGNTPLYFLLRYRDVASDSQVMKGVHWLLDHGADANMRCGGDDETSLHVAVRRRQDVSVIELLLQNGADVHVRDVNGRTAWTLAERMGATAVRSVLERAGAAIEPLSEPDELIAACMRGNADRARALTTPSLIASLDAPTLRLLPECAERGDNEPLAALLAAGVPPDTANEFGITALHFAAFSGNAAAVKLLLSHGARHDVTDYEHHSTPLGWACFNADFRFLPQVDVVETVRALLEAGAMPRPNEHAPSHPEVSALLRQHGQGRS